MIPESLSLFADITMKTSAMLLLAWLFDRLGKFSSSQVAALWTIAFAAVAATPLTHWLPSPISVWESMFFDAEETFVVSVVFSDSQTSDTRTIVNNSATGSVLHSIHFGWYLWGAWGAGVFFFLWRWVRGYLRARRITLDSVSLNDSEIRLPLSEDDVISSEHIRVSDAVPSPFLFGYLNPTLMLPASADRWSTGKLVAVFAHEKAHVRRKDLWVRALAEAVTVVFWFNPLVWLAARRLRLAQEKACDDLALESGVEPLAYTSTLAQMASALIDDLPDASTVSMARKSTLRSRVEAVLDMSQKRSPAGGKFWLACMLTTGFLISTTGAQEVRSSDTTSTPIDPLTGPVEPEENVVEIRMKVIQGVRSTVENGASAPPLYLTGAIGGVQLPEDIGDALAAPPITMLENRTGVITVGDDYLDNGVEKTVGLQTKVTVTNLEDKSYLVQLSVTLSALQEAGNGELDYKEKTTPFEIVMESGQYALIPGIETPDEDQGGITLLMELTRP
ncbi:MAG: M56 family metallopeptidase [Opitutales bacterium]|nr:M56 family metallopeptidase [Opitutales bacterium]